MSPFLFSSRPPSPETTASSNRHHPALSAPFARKTDGGRKEGGTIFARLRNSPRRSLWQTKSPSLLPPSLLPSVRAGDDDSLGSLFCVCATTHTHTHTFSTRALAQAGALLHAHVGSRSGQKNCSQQVLPPLLPPGRIRGAEQLVLPL